ncbi:beta-galactosidase [Rathayibacter sp. VKM Ac-2630]|uniref:beta-galactosidase n=1 Tax=Rathayibacter sp. VKM Ac-2630 TaxID=1938617 RepID=UPI001F288024|nr:beta-galactosidase [Rathayibacter sp. VKM Ac-2630]
MTSVDPRTHRAPVLPRFAFGGDYNPEQWPREVWREDVRLMQEAGVSMVTLGVFSWGLVETAEGVFDWEWLDEIVGLLHEGGIAIDLATPTAAPPSWLLAAHPEILPVDADLVPIHPGGRLGWCPSSAVFRRHALRIAGALAERYGRHPAVALWHVSNELGGGNRHCWCDESAAAFRRWLRDRYETLDALNAGWGTAFWGHRYSDFEQILPPRGSRAMHNPGLQLDFDRFSSDELLAHYLAEKEVLRAAGVETPITTNFMVGQGPDVVDYARWAPHCDIVVNDHYTTGADPRREQDLAFSADRMRGLTEDRAPWLLLEHSTGAASWQPRNRAKDPGEILRNSLAHVARGSDGAMFFQWRASTAGAEQFHSAMLPHAGTGTKIWREVVELGALLQRLEPVLGTRVEPARVALLHDDEAGWAFSSGLKPHNRLRWAEQARAWHRVLFDRTVLVDVVPPWRDLSGYSLVVVPALFLVSDGTVAALTAFAEAGGTVIVTPLSGIVDPANRVRTGLAPGAFSALLGAGSEEFGPLQEGETFELDTGWRGAEWTERVHAVDAEVVARYRGGVLDALPAVTRRRVGAGEAWYVSALLDDDGIGGLLDLLDPALTAPVLDAPRGVEAVRREGPAGRFLFLLNHTDEAVVVEAGGRDLVSGDEVDGSVAIPAGGVRVVALRAGGLA